MATKLKQIEQNMIQKEVLINENLDALANAAKFSYKYSNTSGLVFAYYGGDQYLKDGTLLSISDSSVTLAASKVNYVEFDFSTKRVVANQTGFTTGNIPLYQILTSTNAISDIQKKKDYILSPLGTNFYNDKINSKSAAVSASGNTNITFQIDKSFTIFNKKFDVFLKCIKAVSGFKLNDEVDFWTDGNIKPITLDLTNNYVKLSIINNKVQYLDSTTNTIVDADPSSWVFYCKVYN